ncbi:aryl-alcohol oxidase-like protein [Lyophyllum atratum]|nr:aryl-alcohol oxidase-like protein [Lyophyllum atratum]
MVDYRRSLLGLATFGWLVQARLYTRPQDLKRREYDYVIVGGGTAGSVLASRLSANPTFKVLVVEAGGSNVAADDDLITVPFFAGMAAKSTFNWNYTTTAQAGFNNRSIPYPRGHVLGGSSSINFMFFTRGSSDDWDQFARIAGDDGWSWKNIFPYFIKSESHVPPADRHNTTGEFDPKVHGFSGPLLTSLPGLPTILDPRVARTTVQLKSEFSFNEDMNSGNPLGIGALQSTIGNGARSSAATAYLMPALSQRSNLDVLINTRVTKLVQTGHRGSTPIYRGIQISQGSNNKIFSFTASRELLLTAGAIGTPQLLMLSGIGDAKSLKSLGIKAVVDLTDVGNNMVDHPFVALQWSVNSNNTNDALNQSPDLLQAATEEYNASRQGPLANNPGGNNLGFLRLPSDTDVLKGRKDPAAGPKSPHFELTFGNSFLSFTQTPPASGNYMSILIALVSPTSRGSLKLASSDAFAQPIINPNMLAEEIDILILSEAVKAAQRLVKAPAWDGFIIAPFADSVNLTSDAAIKKYIRDFSSSFNHVVGTAKISKTHDKSGVVGPDLKVKGVEGLRVVDGSVLPFIFGAHPQAIVYAIAERAADLIQSVAEVVIT